MSLLDVLRHRAPSTRTPTTAAPSPVTRNVVAQLIRRPQWTASLNAPRLTRLSSNARIARSTRQPPTLKLREEINIFHAGSPAILAIGLIRITTIVIAVVGSTLYPIMYYMSPDHSNWHIPLFFLASPIPLLLMLFTTGPFIHSISVKLPNSARVSKDTLRTFANRPEPHTLLRLRYMKLLPWPTQQLIPFGRLRRIKPSFKAGWANLEYVKEHLTEEPLANKNSIWFWLWQGVFGRYHVNREMKTDRAAVPGVWDKMWERIPEAGSKEDPLVARMKPEKSRRPVALSGRPGRRL